MRFFLVSCIAFICACSSNSNTREQVITPMDSIQNQAFDPYHPYRNAAIFTLEKVDTLFLYRKITEEYYHAVYIDTTHQSAAFESLTDFNYSEFEQEIFLENINYQKENNPVAFKDEVNKTKIAKNWLPVYSFRDNYYLYSPSDRGSSGKRIINKNSFVFWYMDGPYPLSLKSIEKTTAVTHELEMEAYFQGKLSSKKLIIHEIDGETNLSIFEFPDEDDRFRYELYVPIESAKNFDLIVNYCDLQKQLDLEFDVVDFKGLLGGE